MYIVKVDSSNVRFFANAPNDGIDWATVGNGSAVFLLSDVDSETAKGWSEAGSFSGGVAATYYTEGENTVIDNPGSPPAWSSSGNKVVMLAGGSVELRDANDNWHATLTAVSVIVNSEA